MRYFLVNVFRVRFIESRTGGAPGRTSKTADLSTALRSGRDDRFVRQMATNCKPRNILNLATNLSSRPERSAVERSAVLLVPGTTPCSASDKSHAGSRAQLDFGALRERNQRLIEGPAACARCSTCVGFGMSNEAIIAHADASHSSCIKDCNGGQTVRMQN
jgi:hypothetical protein